LPGLLAGDIEEFGRALTEIQREVGSIFAARQGGVFHPRAAPVVDALTDLGVTAVGQSSWGPAVYGIVDDPDRAAHVAQQLRAISADAAVSVVDFDRRGATVTVATAPERA
jgi:predicted sugar kinase